MKRRWSRNLTRVLPLPWVGGNLGSLVFIFAALALLTISILSPSAMGGMRSSISDMFSPALQVLSRPVQDAAVFVRNITGLAELQAENTRLQQENEKLREWYQTALVLESENNSLRDLLNVKLEPQNNYITARILADSGRAFVKSLLVSSGAEDGVRKGQAVISGEGLVGRITEAGQSTARILLVTDINSRVPVLVENSSQHAVLAGTNGANPELTHLPVGSEIEEGARIITSGHGGLFPAGIPVGRVVISGGNPHVSLFSEFDRMVYVRVVDRAEDSALKAFGSQ